MEDLSVRFLQAPHQALNASISLDDRKPLTNILNGISSKYKSVHYVDMHGLFCEDGVCSNIMNNRLLYLDASPHVTKYGSELTASSFLEVFQRL